MGKVCTSPVFNLSVSAMYQLCGEPVAVDLVNNKTVYGNIFTFDPVTHSIVILVFACNAEPKMIKVITGKSIKDLRKFDNDHLPDGCIKRTPDLECWLGKLLRGTPQSSKEQVSERRKRLIEWLEQNQIRVTSNSDGSITLFDAVRIVAPFTAENCLFLPQTHAYEDLRVVSKLSDKQAFIALAMSILDAYLNKPNRMNILRKKRRGGRREMEMLYSDNKIAAMIRAEEDSGGSPDNQGLIKELSAENRNFKEMFVDGNQAGIVQEEHENNKSDNNMIVEDALERTINEVAETSLQSAAVEGEDLTNEDSRKKSKYDWDAPIVKDIVRRVKNHRLSHAKAAEQLSLLMDAKVTSIGVRLQVVKMANDEALAKQDQRSSCIKTFKSGNSSPDKVANKATDTSMRERENKSPVSYRTRSKTGVKQSAHSLQSSKSENSIEVHVAPANICEGSSQCIENTNNGISLPMTTVQSDTTNNQLFVPVIISQPTSGAAAATKMVPPVIRLLDNEGKLTHIAVAENGSYKLYRVNESATNAEQMQMVNQAVSTSTSSLVTESGMNGMATSGIQRTMKSEKNMAPSCSANYFIESVPAQQTLGALVGIPKFVNPQRYGGSNIYTRTIGPVSGTGNITCAGGMRSRSEIKEKVKKLIHCLKSQHISCEEAVKELFEYVALNPSNMILPAAKQMNDADEIKQKMENNIDYDIPLPRECSTENGNEPYARLVDEQGNMNIAIAEGEGYRVYRLNKTMQNRELYKCTDCDLLHKTKKDPIATVEIIDGMLIGDIHPLHHPRCPLQTLSVKECEQNSVSDERESLLFHEATTDVEEGRRGSEPRKSGSIKRTPKQNGRKNQYTTKSPVRKRPHVVPERSLGMTLRKRKTRTLTSPGLYDSEVM